MINDSIYCPPIRPLLLIITDDFDNLKAHQDLSLNEENLYLNKTKRKEYITFFIII